MRLTIPRARSRQRQRTEKRRMYALAKQAVTCRSQWSMHLFWCPRKSPAPPVKSAHPPTQFAA